MRSIGSSPLARGLRLDSRPDGALDLDHPRSRGVYPRTETPVWSAEGSSPLARGLPAIGLRVSARPRIIPARAGFTSTRTPESWTSSDHPRSRGVYEARRASSRPRQGSSPLARGLHDEADPLGDRGRIIPARAGFTPSSPTTSPPTMDHPRSRGVYKFACYPYAAIEGSSPLARGLRQSAK